MNRQFPIEPTIEMQAKLERLAETLGGDNRTLLYDAARTIRQLDLLRVHIRACVRD